MKSIGVLKAGIMVKNNVVSYQRHAKVKEEERRAKILKGVDRKKIQEYYQSIVKPSISHFSLLQRFLIDEYLMDILFLFFVLGVDASRLCMSGEHQEAVVAEKTLDRNLGKLAERAGRLELNQYIDDWDMYAIQILAEDIAGKWIQEGISYGIKQRKMRLL